jgi:3-deoxy-D-manno-octulosonic-acid transferase
MGNIKFDVDLDTEVTRHGAKLRSELFGERPVWIAASTHDGEEQQVLDAHQKLLEKHRNLLLIIVPRHPERFAGVRALIENRGFNMISRTDELPCDASADVFLLDTMGEVPLFYAASDIAFVGGSLVPTGGHNLLEPAAQGLPIIFGPHVFNAQDIADMFVEFDACRQVEDAAELATTIARLIENPHEAAQLGQKALALLDKNRGALERLLVLLEPLLGGEKP